MLTSLTLLPNSARADSHDPKVKAYRPTTAIGEIVKIKITELHPAQFAVGEREVKQKQDAISKMDKQARKEFLDQEIAPVVRGPGGLLYITDHHHGALALLREGHHHMHIKLIEDWSQLTPDAFRDKMVAAQLAYLFDENGNPKPWSMLPETVKDMKDDPYRSLAGAVEDAKGFKKTTAKFMEFIWANFFRKSIQIAAGKEAFEKAVQTAVALAHSSAAQALPGYISPAELVDITEAEKKVSETGATCPDIFESQ